MINYNPALQSSFRLEIPGTETINYFIQRTALPSITMGSINTPYRNHQGNLPDNKIQYDPLNIDLIVSEDFSNRSELQLWAHKAEYSVSQSMQNDLRDITLHLTTSTNNSQLKVVFYNAYPIMVGELPLDAASSDDIVLMCSCTFSYSHYEMVKAAS